MTHDEALAWSRRELTKHRCEGADAGHEASDLLSHAARILRETLFLRGPKPLPAPVLARLRHLIARRRAHEPLARILGSAFFMGREFAVTKDTLIPRPATEIILEAAFAAAPDADLVVDVGTGSGCIAISASFAFPGIPVVATDLSTPALRVARKNARTHLASGVRFAHGDLITPALPDLSRASHPLIIANLPYIPSPAYTKLSLDIRRHEPRSALVSGKDGLAHYRRLLSALGGMPLSHVTLAMEILPTQRRLLERVLRSAFGAPSLAPIASGDGTILGLIATIA